MLIKALALLTLFALTAASHAQTSRPATPNGPPEGIQRIKLWEKTPLVVEGRETDANPTEPTMDLYLPPADKATGTAVIVLPGGGYSNLAMGHEGQDVGKCTGLLRKEAARWLIFHEHCSKAKPLK